MKARTLKKSLTYLFLILFGIVMIYPILWMFFASFKTNNEVFGSLRLLPERFSLDSYIAGWKGTISFSPIPSSWCCRWWRLRWSPVPLWRMGSRVSAFRGEDRFSCC